LATSTIAAHPRPNQAIQQSTVNLLADMGVSTGTLQIGAIRPAPCRGELVDGSLGRRRSLLAGG